MAPTNAGYHKPPDLMYRGIDWQPTVRVRHPWLIIFPRRIAPIIVCLLLIRQQRLLLFPRSREPEGFTDALGALPSHRPALEQLRPVRLLHRDMARIGAICLIRQRSPLVEECWPQSRAGVSVRIHVGAQQAKQPLRCLQCDVVYCFSAYMCGGGGGGSPRGSSRPRASFLGPAQRHRLPLQWSFRPNIATTMILRRAGHGQYVHGM